jgi:hypothetical protein
MAFSVDMSGLAELESAVALLQAQQSASPSGFVSGQSFACTYGAMNKGTAGSAIAGGSTPSTMTIAQLLSRLQALVLAVSSLPQ